MSCMEPFWGVFSWSLKLLRLFRRKLNVHRLSISVEGGEDNDWVFICWWTVPLVWYRAGQNRQDGLLFTYQTLINAADPGSAGPRVNEPFFFSCSGCLRLSRGGSSCSGHTKPNTRAPPVCPQCQDKDPSQPGQETGPPRHHHLHPQAEAHFLWWGQSGCWLIGAAVCAFPWRGGALTLLLGVSL